MKLRHVMRIVAVAICVLYSTVNAEDESIEVTTASVDVDPVTPTDDSALSGPLTEDLINKLNRPVRVPDDIVEVEDLDPGNDDRDDDEDNYDKKDDRKQKMKPDSEEFREIDYSRGGNLYKQDLKMGDMGDLAGANKHRYVPREYKDFARRSANIDRDNDLDRAAEEKLHRAVQDAQKEVDDKDGNNEELRPVKADPQVVLDIAHQSAQLEASKPANPSDAIVQANIVRSGDYWNTFWKEDVVNPSNSLRAQKKWHRNRKPRHKLEAVRVKVMPGSKLYKLVALTKRISPKLLYIINNGDD